MGVFLLRWVQALEAAITTLEGEYESIEALKVEVSPLQKAKDRNAEPIKTSETHIPDFADSNDFWIDFKITLDNLEAYRWFLYNGSIYRTCWDI